MQTALNSAVDALIERAKKARDVCVKRKMEDKMQEKVERRNMMMEQEDERQEKVEDDGVARAIDGKDLRSNARMHRFLRSTRQAVASDSLAAKVVSPSKMCAVCFMLWATTCSRQPSSLQKRKQHGKARLGRKCARDKWSKKKIRPERKETVRS